VTGYEDMNVPVRWRLLRVATGSERLRSDKRLVVESLKSQSERPEAGSPDDVTASRPDDVMSYILMTSPPPTWSITDRRTSTREETTREETTREETTREEDLHPRGDHPPERRPPERRTSTREETT